MKMLENLKRANSAQLANARGMTLIEIMIVITIMASIMSVVGVFVVGALEEADIQEAGIQMGNFEQQLDMYYARTSPHEYPERLEQLVDKRLMKDIPADPWGTPYVYRRDSRNEYTLKSAGPDGTEGTEDDVIAGETTSGE
jgi:general secretion pathway protein G